MVDLRNWMSLLPSSTKLSKISIPGTHESMTSHDTNKCRPGCLTQTMSLYNQLMGGVRFIDVSIKQDPNNPMDLKIQSGNIYLGVDLSAVFQELERFLRIFKDETVVLSWKEYENGGISKWEALDNVFQQYSDLIYVGKYSSAIFGTPTLGEVRGKVVLMNYKKSPSKGSKAFSPRTDLNNDTTVPIANHRCVCFLTEIALHMHIRHAGKTLYNDQYYMTWVNYKPPNHRCRKKLNDAFHRTLVDEFKTEQLYETGIIIMDFPTKEYIKTIVFFNFRGNLDHKYIQGFTFSYFNVLI